MSERSDRSERFTWSEGDLEITRRPDPPRRRESEKRPEQEPQEMPEDEDDELAIR